MKKLFVLLLSVFFIIGCQPAAESDEVVIGFIGGLSGSLASVGGPIQDSVSLAVDAVNTNNVIPGKTLRVVYEDDACEAKLSTNAAQKLINQDKVKAIIGPMCSGPVLAVAPIAESAGVPIISYSGTSPDIKSAGDYVFRNVPSDSGQGVEAAQIAKELDAASVGVIYVNNDWGVALKDVFMQEAASLGLEIVSEETYEQESTDFRTQLTKIKESNPDAIYLPAYAAEGGLLLKQIAELGIEVDLIGADGLKSDEVIEVAGEAAEGLIIPLSAVPESPELEAFSISYETQYGRDYGVYTPEAYDVVHIIAKACANTDCSSGAIKDFLYSMGEFNGASGKYSFDSDGEVVKSFEVWQISEGEWILYP